jgi:hypothetical protein
MFANGFIVESPSRSRAAHVRLGGAIASPAKPFSLLNERKDEAIPYGLLWGKVSVRSTASAKARRSVRRPGRTGGCRRLLGYAQGVERTAARGTQCRERARQHGHDQDQQRDAGVHARITCTDSEELR